MTTTIDHIDGLVLSDTEVKRLSNELNALRYLKHGLSFLASQVGRIEAEVQQRIPTIE